MGTQEILLHQAKTEGLEQGLEQGLEKGASIKESEKNQAFTTSLLISTDFDDAKTALLVGIDEDYVKNLRENLTISST